MRFKAGDKVRVKKFKKRPSYWNLDGKMDHLMGKVVKIERTVSSRYVVHDSKNDYDWIFRDDDLKPVNETIVIYSKEREVIAVDKVTGDKAIARCSPADEYDFHVGAKLAFDRLMNSNKESTTVEDMRKRLRSYCEGRSCSDCILDSPTCRCGCCAHFMSKDGAGNYTMSNKEIKAAFNIVFGTGFKEDKPKELHKFKVGDIVKGNSESGRRYSITNDNMTRGKVVGVAGGLITIEVLSHKTMPEEVGEEYAGLESEYFDLVEEAPKLYNGKIVFTKGDSIFKTGHIYEVKDGRINTDQSGRVPTEEPFKDIEDVKDYFVGKCDGSRKRKRGWSPYTLELMEVKED
jgi:hypothetical protein